MQIKDLSKQLGVSNKELIDDLKSKGFKITSHMNTVTQEMVDAVKEPNKKTAKQKESKKQQVYVPSERKYELDDLIPCRSCVPWKLVIATPDHLRMYVWDYFGDVQNVAYRDLQTYRRKPLLKDGKIMIEDPELLYRWRKDLGDTYKTFLEIESLEDFFTLSDAEFREKLETSPDPIKEVISIAAMEMIHKQNYPDISKLSIIDEILGTCIKEFL